MNDNKKYDFYLKHYTQIEEWARLKIGITNQLKETIDDAFKEACSPDPCIIKNDQNPRDRGLWQLGSNNGAAYVELTWFKDELFSTERSFPMLAICGNQREQIRLHLQEEEHIRQYNYRKTGAQIWVREVTPDQLPFSIDEYGRECVRQLMELWEAVGDQILKISSAQDPVK